MKPALGKILPLAVVLGLGAAGDAGANPADTAANQQPGRGPLDGDRVFQDYAPEYLEIKVTGMQIGMENHLFNNGKSQIRLQAEVLRVYRSGSGLRAGQTIPINYERKNSTGFGDTQPTMPKKGDVTAAFLRQDGDHYVPAAQQYTFAPLTAAQMERLNPRQSAAAAGTASPAVDDAGRAAPAPAPASDIQLRPEDSAAPATGGAR
jgi:hypothetical protein